MTVTASDGLLTGSATFPWTVTECEGIATQVKAVASDDERLTEVVFNSSDGQLDPHPLLETQIQVSSASSASCVMAHFSAEAEPACLDINSHIVFQVSIDDVPMAGHGQYPHGIPPPATPVVWDPKQTEGVVILLRMVAYNFVGRVTPGVHTVRVRFAGTCISINPLLNYSGRVRMAVLTLRY